MSDSGKTKRKLLAVSMLLVLVSTYVFQRFDFFSFFGNIFDIAGRDYPYARFAFNRALRMVINDTACVVLIAVWFRQESYTRMATWVFVVEVLVILPLYLWIKLSLEGDSEISSPILSQVHRLIVNPMLMILLMVAFLYQRRQESAQKQQ
jgi:exosortase F-associated protein